MSFTCFHKCGFGLGNCSNHTPCPMHEQYKVVRDGFFEIVKIETIESLSEKIQRGEAVLNRLNI